MSLIKCEECGNDISEYAKQCPHCGYKAEHGFPCKDCGAIVKKKDNYCINCGCPLGRRGNFMVAEVIFSKTKGAFNNTWDKINISRKNIVLIGLILTAAIVGSILIYQYTTHIPPEEYESIAKETGEEIMELSDDAHDAGTNIVLCLISKYYGGDDGDKFDTFIYEEKIRNIEKESKEIRKTINKLSNPPVEYKDMYDTLCAMYSNFDYLLDLLEDPPASPEIYAEEGDEYDSCYDRIRGSYEDFEGLFSETETNI